MTPLLLFAAFSAALEIYAGNRLQALSPILVAAISFTLVAALFLGGLIARRGAAAACLPLRTRRRDVAAINLSTAASWLSMLVALKHLEPAVVNVVSLAIGPALTVLLGALLRRRGSVLVTEMVASLGICAFIALLVWGTFTGRSGVGHVGAGNAAIGVLLTLTCGLASTISVIYSKRLSDAGQSPESVLAIRFFLTIAVTWTIAGTSEMASLAAALLPATVITGIGVALPLYLIQLGIEHTEPITASLITSLSPLVAFLLQLLDRRLQPSVLTLAGVVGITSLVAAAAMARGRHGRRSQRENRCASRRRIEGGLFELSTDEP
ncbi:DMT family transporter [Sorangium sp. So ce834]|uniref:EamA family transporter n=1 Tax=Sorangium sp. So ce834 TaxID=3133321 RepID=UPI003F605C2D